MGIAVPEQVTCSYMGMVQSITHSRTEVVTIWGFWKESPYGKHYHMGIPIDMRANEKIPIWGLPVAEMTC